MTDNERFELVEDKQFDGLCIKDNIKKEWYCYDKSDLKKLCKKINNLQKKKDYYKELRIHLNGLIGEKVEEITDSNCRLEKENIELKRKKQSLESSNMELYEIIDCKDDIIKEIKQENQQLKQESTELKSSIKKLYNKYIDESFKYYDCTNENDKLKFELAEIYYTQIYERNKYVFKTVEPYDEEIHKMCRILFEVFNEGKDE